jgi:glycosyltransferase involved in cell wall biosynthesis
MKKIKIARIVTVPFTFISLLGLFDSLNEDDRFEVHLVSGTDAFEEVLKKRYPNFRFHYINIPRKVRLMDDLKALVSLCKLFAIEKFDIVHSHTPKAGILSALAGFFFRVPIRIHTFTGQVWVEYKSHKLRFFKFLDNSICHLNTLNYVDSLSQREYLLRNNVGTPDKLVVLHKGSIAGINMNKFNPERVRVKAAALRQELFPDFNGKIILYLGRINNDKGLIELGNAYFELKKNYKLKLLIVGPSEYISQELELVLNQLRADNDTKFLGFVSNAEEYYLATDVYCLPSYREGCPTSVLEASAMGKPVIASNIYGISDITIDMETALIFEVRNTSDLIAKFKKLFENEDLGVQLGKRGRKFVSENFSEKILTQEMINEYLKFVDKKI